MMTIEPRRKLGKRKTKRDSAAERERREKALELGLEDSSPASDPVAPFNQRHRPKIEAV